MNTDKLFELADHLESGNLGHKHFHLTTFHTEDENGDPDCGCALGECPFVWPDDWYFNMDNKPVKYPYDIAFQSAIKWFDINASQYDHLFEVNKQMISRYGGKELNMYSGPMDVAYNIRCLIEECKNCK